MPHVQHDYFSSFNQSNRRFLVSPFPFPSSLLKLPPDIMMITGKGITKNIFRVVGWYLTNDNRNAGQMLQLLSYTGTLGSLAKK